MSKIYGLVDCNNFFVSCEKVFNPKLKNVPVVVLSNNDGCIVARSQEARALGIKMGEPYFKNKTFLDEHNVTVLSSNFSLYTDISKRIMNILNELVPNVSIYSVDEAFLDFSQMRERNLTQYASYIKEYLYKCTGIPVSIGLAKTKTLAKLANHKAKKDLRFNGVMDLNILSENDVDAILKDYPIEEVWGVGRNSQKMLNNYGVNTAYHFKMLDDQWVKKKMSITGWRLLQELRGIDTNFEEHDLRKSLMVSRTFGGYITDRQEILGVLSNFCSQACEHLRRESVVAKEVTIYIRTNYNNKKHKQYFNSISFQLSSYSSYTPTIMEGVEFALKQIFKSGYKYRKAGILFTDIKPEGFQANMFAQKENTLAIKSIDEINRRWKGAMKLGCDLLIKGSIGNREMTSPRYTTSWEELMVVGG